MSVRREGRGRDVDSGGICGIIFNCLLPHGIGFVAVALFCYAFNLPKLPFVAEQAEEEPSRAAAAAAGVTTRRPQWQKQRQRKNQRQWQWQWQIYVNYKYELEANTN